MSEQKKKSQDKGKITLFKLRSMFLVIGEGFSLWTELPQVVEHFNVESTLINIKGNTLNLKVKMPTRESSKKTL
jgi:hypothetical protein